VRVHTDAICSIAYGANPTATINSFRMNANTTEYFGVNPGDKIAVISNT
jgi:orotate phosphoribosyltransferase